MRKCTTCKTDKELVEFYFAKTRNKHDSICKACRKLYWANRREKDQQSWRARKYGVPPDVYDKMLVEQNGVCAICGQVETKVTYGRIVCLAIDHDHLTGIVRALLCSACNAAIAFTSDSSQRVDAVAAYLRRHGR